MRAGTGATGETDLRIDERAPRMRDAGTTSASAAARPAIAFFCPDVTESSTLKRVQQFWAAGFDLTVYGFRRARYNTGFRPTWRNVPLGVTADARYGQRLGALLLALPALVAHLRQLAKARLFHARNIDQLPLVLFCRFALVRRPVAVVYEVLDIAPILSRARPPRDDALHRVRGPRRRGRSLPYAHRPRRAERLGRPVTSV